MRSRWIASGFLASCFLFAAYWSVSAPLADQPRYGFYCRRFIDFVRAYPVPGYADQYQFIGDAGAALGAFHVLNPPLLITTLGSDRFTASSTPFWRSDWRFCVQAICLSLWWWWFLGRLAHPRGNPRVTLLHAVLVIPLLSLGANMALYSSTWIRGPHGLAGFSNVAPLISLVALGGGVVWARSNGLWRPHIGVALVAAAALLALLCWPPMVLASWRAGAEAHYWFAGHRWILLRVQPSFVTHSSVPLYGELHVALNLLATEALIIAGVLLASMGRRPSNPLFQRTRASARR